ncbi:hypothetical protein ABS199_19585, partial [Acinetobacter baumannii]|uniref:hypothetical protein n=1 Tax=Acinetobacter baumannii TaxID=470 RepID=UPI00332A8830
NCAKAVRKKTKGLLLLFNMDFGDNKTGVFTYVMSLPMLADKDDTAISYELIKHIELTWEQLKEDGVTTMMRIDGSRAPIFLRASDQT